jgi:uncharacterized protein (TIGR03067 family)
MKTLSLVALMGSLLALGVGLVHAASDEAAQKEYARFAGTWKLTSVEVEGKGMPPEQFKSARLALKGPHFSYTEQGRTSHGTFKVDVSKSPRHIDVTFTDGPQKGKTLVGIYELTDKTYKVCLGMPGKSRPTSFVTKPGSGHVLEVLQRDNAPPKAGADVIRKELAKLEGTWQLVSAETDGKKMPEEQARQVRVVIKGGKHTVYFGDKAVVQGVAFRIDPTQNPMHVEDTLKDGRTIRGIYELDGDTLRSCVAAAGQDRPTEFTGRQGSGYTLRIFRRAGE